MTLQRFAFVMICVVILQGIALVIMAK